MTEEYLISCQNKLDEIKFLQEMIKILKQSEREFLHLYATKTLDSNPRSFEIEPDLFDIVRKYYDDKLERLQKEFNEM